MQTAFCFWGSKMSFEKKERKRGGRVTERELEILEFILKMKFSTLKDIHSKFFLKTKRNELSTSTVWARQRLCNLCDAGFIERNSDLYSRSLFTITRKGYFYLRNLKPNNANCRPLFTIDTRTLDHDLKVIRVRKHIEQNNLGFNWISERELCFSDTTKFFNDEFRPDGIYLSNSGERIALELELSQKSKDRYSKKVRWYRDQILNKQSIDRPFDKINYIFEKPNVGKILNSEISLFKDLFSVEPIASYISEYEVPDAKC